MQQTHADAIARAILEPDPAARAAIQRKRDAEAQQRVESRRLAWLVLLAMPVGALVAHATGHDFASGALYGGFAAVAIAGVLNAVVRRRAHSR